MTAAAAAKEIKSRRLELRELCEDDGDALYDAIDSSRAVLKRRLRWVSLVNSVQDCRAFIRSSLEENRRGARVDYALVDAKNKDLVGVVSLQGLLDVPGVTELSGWVRADYQDRGYASEAGKILLTHAFRRPALHRVYARIDPANRAARRVFKRLGFYYEGCLRRAKRLNGRWIDQECWSILREECKP